MSDSRAVILASEEQLNVPSIGAALASYYKEPLPDAMQKAKVCWGILAERKNEADAAAMTAHLDKKNLKTLAIDQEKLRVLLPAKTVAKLEFLADKLVLTEEGGTPHEATWPSIHVIGAAGLKTFHTHKVTEVQPGASASEKALRVGIMLATGLPVGMGAKKKTVEKTVTNSELIFFMDLLLTDRTDRFRLMADKINYAFLKERRQYGAMVNFKLMLADIKKNAPQARLSRGASILLAGQPVNTMGYETMNDVERECRWLWALPLKIVA